MEQETKKRRENVVAGVVGAFLGSLIGVACTVIVGQLGYTAAFTGLIMAVGALKGYELMGGTLSKKGAAISCVLVLVMTWFAHRLTWAVAVAIAAELNVFSCFQAVPNLLDAGVIESRAYWADLVLLYVFTLVGAVPMIVAGLRSAAMPDLPQNGTASPQEPGTPDAVFYVGEVKWMRPLKRSALLAALVAAVPMVVLLVLCIYNDAAITYSLASLGCAAAVFIMLGFALPCTRLTNCATLLLVRVNGTLWKVSPSMLNTMDTYRFTKKIGVVRVLQWDMLNEEERERAKASALRAINLLAGGQVMPGSNLSLAVTPLTNLRIDKETKWAWKGVYSAGGGKEKKVSIPKAYPNFAPGPGLEPAEGPVPARWDLLAVGLLLTAILGFVGGGFGKMLGGSQLGAPSPAPSPSHTQAPAPTPTPDAVGAVTDEEARALFHLADELGCDYIGTGYIKAPEGMLTRAGYVDAYVPYSDAPEYLDGGYGIRSAAHGMEVTVNITPQTSGNAETVVDSAYGLLESAGVDIYEDGTSETEYFEEYDIAVKRVTYYEENRTRVRIAVLYADYKQDGYYLSAAIVYQPELMDEDYLALLAELSDVYALSLPEIPPMDQA